MMAKIIPPNTSCSYLPWELQVTVNNLNHIFLSSPKYQAFSKSKITSFVMSTGRSRG